MAKHKTVLLIENKQMEQVFLSYKNIQNKLGKSRSIITRWVQDGLFPKPRQIASQVVGWLQRDIDQWIDSLPLKSINPKVSALSATQEECNQ